jgi:hypothetical protein
MQAEVHYRHILLFCQLLIPNKPKFRIESFSCLHIELTDFLSVEFCSCFKVFPEICLVPK